MGALSKTTQVQFRHCAKIGQTVKKIFIKNIYKIYFISNRLAKTTEFHKKLEYFACVHKKNIC